MTTGLIPASTACQESFDYVSVAHELYVVDDSQRTIKSRHIYCLRALNRERFFVRAYRWTGSGVEKDPIIDSGKDDLGHALHRLHGPVLRHGQDRLFLIDLGRALEVGEETEVRLEQSLIDLGQSFQPYLGATGKLNCEKISLTVSLPIALKVDVKKEIRDPRLQHPQRRELLPPKPTCQKNPTQTLYQWEINAPEPGTLYRIAWDD